MGKEMGRNYGDTGEINALNQNTLYEILKKSIIIFKN